MSGNRKKNILFVGANTKPTDAMWGGSIATSYNFFKSMEQSNKYDIQLIDRAHIKTPDDLREAVNGSTYDLLHVDEARITQLCYLSGIQPDVLGPIARAPNGVKQYTGKDGIPWDSIYTPEWFYRSVVIRLNANEEKAQEYRDKYITISQGIDVDYLTPHKKIEKPNLILWAGDANRPAKNFALMQEIMSITDLPAPYEFKIMSGYNVADYWDALNSTAVLINTSRYESFCAALFEAKAKGVPTIYRKKLHNDRFLDGHIQVDYTPQSYKDALLDLLSSPNRLREESEKSRDYCVQYASYETMRASYESAYDVALNKKEKGVLCASS